MNEGDGLSCLGACLLPLFERDGKKKKSLRVLCVAPVPAIFMQLALNPTKSSPKRENGGYKGSQSQSLLPSHPMCPPDASNSSANHTGNKEGGQCQQTLDSLKDRNVMCVESPDQHVGNISFNPSIDVNIFQGLLGGKSSVNPPMSMSSRDHDKYLETQVPTCPPSCDHLGLLALDVSLHVGCDSAFVTGLMIDVLFVPKFSAAVWLDALYRRKCEP